ncbi:hypothetical protein [Streptomyces sp. NPDC029554]|uniref:hypothetical protein n=1 Tax=Streptomyces sp. NPDC029554 TaxID=3155126 RepID=UPI00340C123B
MSTSTAWHWAQRGAELWQHEGRPEGLAVALAALPPLDDLAADIDQLAALPDDLPEVEPDV